MKRHAGLASLGIALAARAIACHERRVETPPDAPVATLTTTPPGPSGAPGDGGPTPRCAFTSAAASPSFGQGAELGAAVADGEQFAIGALIAVDGRRTAAIVRADLTHASTVELGAAYRGAPAPQPLPAGTQLYAVAYARPASSAVKTPRGLAVFRVGATAERLVDLPVEHDASAAFDAAVGLGENPVAAVVTWDDEASSPVRSVVKLATLGPGFKSVRSVEGIRAAPDPSAPATDLSDPRVLPRAGGYWLAWLARRPEHVVPPPPLPAGEIETTSEEPTYIWVEAVPLDAAGAVQGAARRLTSALGHVSSYSAFADDDGLHVFAVDEGGGAGAGRGGGSLEAVSIRKDAVGQVSTQVRAGVEYETAPGFLLSSSGERWLSFLDVAGDVELLPLLSTSHVARAIATLGVSPTHEPLLSSGRFVGAVAAGLVLAVADGPAWRLRTASCSW